MGLRKPGKTSGWSPALSPVNISHGRSRCSCAALCLIALLTFAAVQSAPAAESPSKVLRLNWNERRAVGTGYMAFRVSRIVVNRLTWTISAEMTNRTPYAIGINRRRPESFRSCRMGLIAYSRVMQPGGQQTINSQNLEFSRARPGFPSVLPPGARWAGTFNGRGYLPRGKDLYVCFGYFTLAGSEPDFSYVAGPGFRL